MPSIWTVKPDDVKVELSFIDHEGNTNAFWVKLKKRLTVGEERRILTAGWGGMRTSNVVGPEIQVDWQTQSFARAEVYVTDWSLSDLDGKKLPHTREGIESLHPDVFQLIEGAITTHVESTKQEKKANSGETGQ